ARRAARAPADGRAAPAGPRAPALDVAGLGPARRRGDLPGRVLRRPHLRRLRGSSLMLRLLHGLRALFQKVVALVLPFATQARSSPGLWTTLRVLLHVLVVAAVAAALYLVPGEKLAPHIGVRSPFLAKSWLSILFLLLYALGWLSWWLYRLLTGEE